MCPALYLLEIVSDPGSALLIMLCAMLIGVLAPMIDLPAVDPGDDDPVLPSRRRTR